MIQRRKINVDESQSMMSVFEWIGNENAISLVIYVHSNEMLKTRLVKKLLSSEGIIIDGPEIISFKRAHEISESLFELLELLAPIYITENIEMKKIAGDYLDGAIEREKFEREVVAYYVAEKLSK